jgi:hypothetical protein
MITRITVERISAPESNGYNDHMGIYDDAGAYLSAFRCRGWPNPYRPSDLTPCRQAYGAVADGVYNWNTAWNLLKGRFIQIEGGGIVPSVWPNPCHGWALWCEKTAIHKGWSKTWSGSAACLTVHPDDWGRFMGYIIGKMTGKLVITTTTRG